MQRFSNADKHRIVSAIMPLIQDGTGQIVHNGQVVEEWKPTSLPDWEPHREYEIARFRFAKPYPTQMRFEGGLTVSILFGTPAFGKHIMGHAVDVPTFDAMCNHVAMIVDRFKKL